MSSKVSDLKQSLSFRSLRLMEWKDSQGSNVRSFSDSETFSNNTSTAKKDIRKYKSRSETNLSTLKDKKVDQNRDSLKALYISKETNSFSELKNMKTDFNVNLMQDPLRGNEEQAYDHASKSEKSVPRSNLETYVENDKSKSNAENAENISKASNKSDMTNQQTSSPYPVLENEQNSASKAELIVGEPRCLALKKSDINPFLTDDPLIFEPDFEDDNRSRSKTPVLPRKVERKLGKFVNDMFIDDEETSGLMKKGISLDREEGELTPEAPHKSSDLNKRKEPSSGEKKATLEFFYKINECLRELNDKCREFYSSSTPDYSLEHLQRTLGNVDNIKRKLAFLVKSKNTEKEEKEKAKKMVHKSHSNMRLYSERSAKSSSSANDSKREQDKQEHPSGLKNDVEELYRQLKENREKRNSENISRHSHRRERSNRRKPSQADLLNRKKISILEKLGTKQEIERVQSLFKRQMNFITQHVIQKKEPDKKHMSWQKETRRRRRRRYSSESQEEREPKKSRDKASLEDLKTLEDMEAFLESLKKDKELCEQYMHDQKSKTMLKFSSKKEKRVVPEVSSDKPAVGLIKTSKDSKEAFKEPLGKETFNETVSKLNKNHEANLTKQKNEEIKMKNSKNVIGAPDFISHHENVPPPRTNNTSESNLDPRSKTELNNKDVRTESETIIDETNKHRRTHHDLDAKNKTSDFSKGEIEGRGELQQKSHEHLNKPEIGKQEDPKRKREDLSDSNFNKSENENEENNRKKKKVTKYIAARRVSNKDHTKYRIPDKNTNVGTAESLVKDLLSKKLVILDDNGVAVNNEFCIKVINNEVFLKKVSNKRKRKRTSRALKPHQSKNIRRNRKDQPAHEEKLLEVKPKLDEKPIEPKEQEIIVPDIDPETIDDTLNEMENFLQDLRSKRKVRDDENHHPIENTSQNREMKFLARIQAKRKAKLMACVSEGMYSTEKEAKFLKALEKRDEDVSESSDVETRKQALLEKIRAEKDAISEKPKAKQNDDDPLKDVKAFLDMIKEAESGNAENAKQVYVSFSLKRSDVKKLENLTTGKTSLLTEESQKFLNSVRSKMKAKKTPSSGISALMKKPEG